MGWNYRVVKRKHDRGWRIAIHEVFYNDEGKPDGVAQNPEHVSTELEDENDVGPSIDALEDMLKKMLASLKKPVLDYDEDFTPSKVIEPNLKNINYYFKVVEAKSELWGANTLMILSKKVFFDKNGHLDDRERGQEANLPVGFYNVMEAVWETDESVEEARKLMIEAGFTENSDLPVPE